MKRDFGALGREHLDLLVIGGGIYGAWTAYDAALRGLRTALVEQQDWAAATSSASSKLIHGGLRYLERFEFRLVRTSLDERRRLVRLGPHRVRPLRFVLPVYRGDPTGRLKLRAGLWLYDRLAGRDQPVDGHEGLGRAAMLRRYGLLREQGLCGGFTYGDCGTDDARLTLEIVSGAAEAGALVLNRARVESLLLEDGRVRGARVREGVSGAGIDVQADLVADTSGPWTGRLLPGSRPPATRLTKGVHLVMPRLPVDEAFLLMSRDDGRVVFLIPWYGRTLLGTTDTDHDGGPGEAEVTPADVSYLLDRANRVLREPWDASRIVSSFAGVRTLPNTGPGVAPSAVTREWQMTEPLPGLVASVGGKLTSARADAASLVDRVVRRLGRDLPASTTAERALPWSWTGRPDDWPIQAVTEARNLGLDEETARTALERHGTRIERILALVADEPGLGRRITPDAPFCVAEIIHAAESEMVGSLEDVVRRRVPLMLIAPPTPDVLAGIAARLGDLLGWDRARRIEEVAGVRGPDPAA